MTGLVAPIHTSRSRTVDWSSIGVSLGWKVRATLYRQVDLAAGRVILVVIAVMVRRLRLQDRDDRGAIRIVDTFVVFTIALTTIGLGSRAVGEMIFYSHLAWNALWTHLGNHPFVLGNWPRWIGLERILFALNHGSAGCSV